jgi:2-amino-4-hydroxy-6-hydroxymethyldihydropteridine diphosphokinase
MNVVVGLGSNLGSREVLLRAALDLIADVPGARVEAISPVYETAPVGGPPQPRYLNAAARITSTLDPHALLDAMLAIERALGRDRTHEPRNGPRTCDIDLLHADVSVAGDRLTLPHQRLTTRAFALAPLLDVAPDLAPLYAAALGAAGGPPPGARPLGEALAVHVAPGRASASGRDLADALAACVTALPRALGDVPLEARGAAHDLEMSLDPDDALAVLADTLLTARLGGLDLRHAVILELDGPTLRARFLGGRDEDPDPRPARLGAATVTISTGVPTATVGLVSNPAGTP